jgi:hypothetical protein
MEITPRARAALNELLSAGYAAPCRADDQIPGREHYAGVATDPHHHSLGELAKAFGINLFGGDDDWVAFRKKGADKMPTVRLSLESGLEAAQKEGG